MREIQVAQITEAVRALCIQANKVLPEALEQCIRCGADQEQSQAGKAVFADLCANLDAARDTNLPICQDTGMAVIFMQIGQDVHITGGDLREAVNKGVAAGYLDGYLRCSVVSDPLERVNTNNNTPAVLHLDIVPGEEIRIDVCPKGFGSENMSAMRMFTPAASTDDIIGLSPIPLQKPAAIPARRSWSVSASAATLSSVHFLRRRRSAAMLPFAMKSRSMPVSKHRCSKLSTGSASVRRASAAP